MASVEQIKTALETEQKQFVELSSKALSAIDTVTALSNWWLSALSFTIAGLALIGFTVVFAGSRKASGKIAHSRMDSYIKGKEWRAEVEKLIREEIRNQLEQRNFAQVEPAKPTAGEESFPKAHRRGEASE